MNLTEQILLMRANLDSAEQHIKQLEAGRKSSSSKARSALQKIKGQSHTLRRDVISTQKALPTKTRVKKLNPLLKLLLNLQSLNYQLKI